MSIRFVLICLFMVAMVQSSVGQCAMCRTQLENNVSNGDVGIAAGINTGILYLLSMPYLIIIVLGYLWFKNSKQDAKRELSGSDMAR